MSETNYTPRWQAHLATTDATEVPLYTPEIAARIQETLDNPRITFERTRAQIQRALYDALKDEPGFRLPTEAEQAADAAYNTRTRP